MPIDYGDGDSWPDYKTGGGGGGGPNISGGGGGGGGVPGGNYALGLRRTLPLSDVIANRRKLQMQGYSPTLGMAQASASQSAPTQMNPQGWDLSLNPQNRAGNYAPSQRLAQPMAQSPNAGSGSAPMGAPASGEFGPEFEAWARAHGYDPNKPLSRAVAMNKWRAQGGQRYPGYAPGTRPTISGEGWQGDIQTLLNAAGVGGVFDPNGSQGLVDLVRAQQEQQAQQNQGAALARARYLSPEDPAAQGYASLASAIGSQSTGANAINNAVLQTRMQNQSRLWDMLQEYFQGQYGNDQMRTQAGSGGTNWGAIAQGVGSLAPLLFGGG